MKIEYGIVKVGLKGHMFVFEAFINVLRVCAEK